MNKIELRKLLDERGLKLKHIAARLSVDKSNVTRWAQRKIPAERVLDVERVTGISRHDLRPDLYPKYVADAAKREASAA